MASFDAFLVAFYAI